MKSRIIKPFPIKILVYNTNKSENDIIKKIAGKFNAEIRIVDISEKNIKLSELLKTPKSIASSSYCESEFKCIVMSGMNQKNVYKFLNNLKSENISIPLKAVITPENQKWTFEKLLAELRKEYNHFN